MKTVTKFVAKDGREFKEEAKCVQHESLLDAIDAAMRAWPKLPDDCSFVNGGGFFKIPLETFHNSRHALLELAAIHCPHEWVDQVRMGALGESYLGRLFQDSDNPLYEPWLRILNVDSWGREWDQGYFTAHPTEGKKICLNP